MSRGVRPRSRLIHCSLVGLGVLLSSALSPAAEQKELKSLLPPEEEVSPWAYAGEPLTYDAETLFNFIDGGAEVYLEYGFVEVISQEYARGEDSVITTVYEMKEPVGAFGVFSYNRSPRKSPLSLGDGGFKGGFQAAFWQERYYVVVESFSSSEQMEQALLSFGSKISDRIGKHASQPAALRRLPGNRLVPGSEKLLKGRLAVRSLFFLTEADVFQLGEEDLVLYGEYEGAGGKAKLFLVIYEKAEKTSQVASRLEKAFSSAKGYRSLSQDGPQSLCRKEDRYLGLLEGPNTLALVAEAHSLEEAREILGGISESH